MIEHLGNNMKIGINSRIYQHSGTGIPNYIEGLYKTLSVLDKKNKYIFFQTKKTKTLGKTKIIPMPNGYLGAFFFDSFLINSLIKKEKIDIFHGPSNSLPFIKYKKTKYIITIHDLTFLVYPQYYPAFFRYYYKFVIGRALKSANAILAVSVNTKKDILRYYNCDEKKVHVVYSGINPVYFAKKTEKRLIKDKYFFSITTHPKRKNINSIISIISRNKQLLQYKYVIAGIIQDDQVKQLRILIDKLNLQKNVLIYGYATEKELLSLYQNAEFFIYPSYYEGYGFPVLEAMAAKCPVIASNNSSLNELVARKDLLVNPYDQNDILTKMIYALTMPQIKKKELIKENYERAKTFTWEKTAQQFIQICENL